MGFLAASSVITMSAPFFLGRVIDVIYTDPAADFGSDLARLCLPLGGLFLCGAAANAVRVYLMQTSGKSLARASSRGTGPTRPPWAPSSRHHAHADRLPGPGVALQVALGQTPSPSSPFTRQG